MKHLITGIAGFAGGHLAEKLLQQNEEVFGLDLPTAHLGKIEHLKNKFQFLPVDLNNPDSVKNVLNDCRPDFIYHLAAVSHVKKSFSSKLKTFEVNVLGAFNLLESVLDLDISPRILFVGSASQYGRMDENEPAITEERSMKPMSPYGLSKICQEYLGLQYVLTHTIPVILVRCFNYTGIRQDPDFVCSDFAKQVAEIELGRRKPVIYVGDTNVRRDFTDVSDMMDAYILAINNGIPGEPYNLCSGNDMAIGEVLSIFLSLTNTPISIQSRNDRFRPADIPYLKGDHSKFTQLTGWQPRINFYTTLKHILDFWRETLQK